MRFAGRFLLATIVFAPGPSGAFAAAIQIGAESSVVSDELRSSDRRTKPTESDFNTSDKIFYVRERVLFAAHRSEVTAEAVIAIDKLVARLKKYPDQTITVEGHADDPGTEAYNQELSKERAEAVLDYLAAKGILLDRVRTVGYGRERPARLGADEDARAQNRRVVFVTH